MKTYHTWAVKTNGSKIQHLKRFGFLKDLVNECFLYVALNRMLAVPKGFPFKRTKKEEKQTFYFDKEPNLFFCFHTTWSQVMNLCATFSTIFYFFLFFSDRMSDV